MTEAPGWWYDCLIVDGPNLWELLKVCGGIPHLFAEFLSQVEERLEGFVQRPVRFAEKIWVSPALNHRRANASWLKGLLMRLQRLGWEIRLPAPMHSLPGKDDQLIKWLLREKADMLPPGSILALSSGDGDFLETLRDIKAERNDLCVVVISSSLPPRFVAHPQLREVADFFLDVLTLPCLSRTLSRNFLRVRVNH